MIFGTTGAFGISIEDIDRDFSPIIKISKK